MKIRVPSALAAAVLAFTAAAASAQQVQLTINNGRVNLLAREATLRQILTEWARVGQTTIVNLERVPGGPMTLQLVNQPEDQALDILLRSLSGYVAAQRPTPVATLSRYDRIMVMPTQAPPRTATAAPLPVPVQQPVQQPVDDEDRPVNVVMPARGPIFPTPNIPQPGLVQPQFAPAQQPGVRPPDAALGVQPSAGQPFPAGPAPVQTPVGPAANGPTNASPTGSSTPGVVIPAPVQPGQIPQLRPSSD